MTDPKPGRLHAVSSKNIVVDREEVKDENGRTKRDRSYNPITKPILGRVHYCPRFGQIVGDKRGTPLAAKDLTSSKKVEQKTCKARYLKSIWSAERPGVPGGETLYSMPSKHADKKPGTKVRHEGREWIVCQCNEPLYNYTSRPYRWAPSAIIQRKLKRMCKYLFIDECHEHKSDSSGQSMACSKLIGAVDHVLGLTGTIIGGYATHLYPLMMRLTPQTLIDEGFEWGHEMDFARIYGRIRTVVTTTEVDDATARTGRVKSMRKATSGNRNVNHYVDPGVMPTMFARHMMGTCIFLTLEELADNLPDLFEYVGGKPSEEPEYIQGESQEEYEYRMDFQRRNLAGWFDTACDMEPE